MKKLFSDLVRRASYFPGQRIHEKIIIFESDDWGSIRMPSKEVYSSLKAKGLNLDGGDAHRYNQFDTLASKVDLENLFEVLTQYKDHCGNHPIFTAVSLCANPDFEKIKSANFDEYHYEPLPVTLERYGLSDAWPLWQEGINNKIFLPQFHGREHLYVSAWMKALKQRDSQTLTAFDYGVWGFRNIHPNKISYQAAFDLEHKKDLIQQSLIMQDGLKLFESLHGYKAEYLVPPNGPINNKLLASAASMGIKYVCTPKLQREPQGGGKIKFKLHYLGQTTKYGQIYITRNSSFEPSFKGVDWVNKCISQINEAFLYKKPAVISTHRVNYIGRLYPENSRTGLKLLAELLDRILTKWPDAKFLSSVDLGNKLANN